MSYETWLTVSGIGLYDALNFPVMLILIVVLGRPHPVANGLALSVGMLGSHFAGGLIFGAGVTNAVAGAVSDLSRTEVALAQLGIGAALLGAAVWMENHPGDAHRGRPPRPLGVAGWFLAGIGITMTKLPVAVAYASAVHLIQQDTAGDFSLYLAGLAYYNALAFLPFFIIWAGYLLWRQHSARLLGELNELIRRHAPIVMRWTLMLVGTVLVADGAGRAFGTPLI